MVRMDDKGEIVSSCDVDENIALQIWTKGLSPRLVVLNKNKNSRKLIHLSWMENRERKLAVQGKKRTESFSYEIADLVPLLQRILSENAVYTAFRPRLWKFSVDLEKVLHAPEIVTDRGELHLLSEERRSSLWIADFTEDDKKRGRFRPFFPLSPEEGQALSAKLEIRNDERTADHLIKTGAVRQLAGARPARWHSPVRIAATAMLLGFSFCQADGSDFVDLLWRGEEPPETPGLPKPAEPGKVSFTLRDPRLMGLGCKLAAFIRHFDAVDRIEERISMDSDKELQEQGYERKRRLTFPDGTLGDVSYSVTFFDDERGRMALGCKPKAATLRHKGELVYSFPTEIYEQALLHDTLGGPPDDFFSVVQLAWARQFRNWYDDVALYVSPFAGLI